MSVPLTPTGVKLPASVDIPADGELVNSASVAGYVQAIINALKWATDYVAPLREGGLVAPLDSLNISAGAGHVVVVQGLSLDHPADGGRGALVGRLRAPKSAVAGALTAGTTSYDWADYDEVYALFTAAAGTSWLFLSATEGARMSCYSISTVSIALLDQAGSTMITLRYASGQPISAQLLFTAGAWKVIGFGEKS